MSNGSNNVTICTVKIINLVPKHARQGKKELPCDTGLQPESPDSDWDLNQGS